jgi:hypothetical protein
MRNPAAKRPAWRYPHVHASEGRLTMKRLFRFAFRSVVPLSLALLAASTGLAVSACELLQRYPFRQCSARGVDVHVAPGHDNLGAARTGPAIDVGPHSKGPAAAVS